MNYFTKIAAYFDQELSELERLVFEQELAENAALQAEVDAYEMAQSLFGVTAETLTEEEIVNTDAATMADEIITFVADNLSEKQILAEPVLAAQPTIIRKLEPRKNRTAWLAAASLLFIISMIGLRFQNEQVSNQNGTVAVTNPPKEVTTPIAKEIIPVIKEEKIDQLVSTPTQEKSVKQLTKAYEPASIKVVKKQKINATSLAANNTKVLPETSQSNPLALNTTATAITSEKVIDHGQEVVYKAADEIVLKEGFHVKSGSTFFATATSDEKVATDLKSAATITGTDKVVYQANETITLAPGFHAKAGIDFVAKTASGSSKEVSSNTIVSDKESVLLKANNSVTLKPGFHAKAGSDFTAKVGK